VRILAKPPTRRRMLRALVGTVAGAPLLLRLGRVHDQRPRRVRPADLAPIPWIGHC
jgi:hypothetical protein